MGPNLIVLFNDILHNFKVYTGINSELAKSLEITDELIANLEKDASNEDYYYDKFKTKYI